MTTLGNHDAWRPERGLIAEPARHAHGQAPALAMRPACVRCMDARIRGVPSAALNAPWWMAILRASDSRPCANLCGAHVPRRFAGTLIPPSGDPVTGCLFGFMPPLGNELPKGMSVLVRADYLVRWTHRGLRPVAARLEPSMGEMTLREVYR